LDGVRIADASVFPTIPAVNPMIGVLMVGEKAADLLRADNPSISPPEHSTTTTPGGAA
ncbi:MAG TPA: GMC oxidoreductase, partial [Streptomyces sp.]|nr:GMC oxidoreductase [Streptomyces sp.]